MPKKLLSLFCAILMLITSFPLAVFAEEINQPKLTIISADVTPGEAFEVNVNLENNPGIVSAGLRLAFDEGLTLVGATNGDVFSTLTYIPPKQLSSGGQIASSCQFAWTGFDIADADIKNGTILTLSFELSDEAEIGDTFNISITSELGDIVDRDLNEYALSAEGKVTAIDYMPGDVNDDTKINMMDIVVLSRYIVDGCKYDPDGYAVRINESAAEVNADSKINMLDVVLISRYIVDGCETVPEPDGYNVTLLPSRKLCSHTLQKTEAKDATCTEEGNIAYWQCTKCNKYFADENGATQISAEDVVVPMTEHTIVIIPGYPATSEKEGLKDGEKCSVCGWIKKAQEPIPVSEFEIKYEIAGSDNYLTKLLNDGKIENSNPISYSTEKGCKLSNIMVDGYIFDGWYDAPGSSGELVKEIPIGSTGKIELYAKWSKETYKISFYSPLAPRSSITRTIDESVPIDDLNELTKYKFMGWTDIQGNIVTTVEPGTKDITLYANWISYRNQTISHNYKEKGPITIEDNENGQYLFVYDIGKIINVPLYTIKDFGNTTSGIIRVESETVTNSISSTYAKELTESIANSTTNSATWTLSKDWNELITNTEDFSETQLEEESILISDGYAHTDGTEKNNGTVKDTGTLTKNNTTTKDLVTTERGNSFEGGVDVKIGTDKTPVSANISAQYEQHKDTTNEEGTVKDKGSDKYNLTHTNDLTSTINSTTRSHDETTSQKIAQEVSKQWGYSISKSEGGTDSRSENTSNTQNKENTYSTSFAYTIAEEKTTVKEFSTSNAAPGWHRLVCAGTIHVFAVVGYDIATHTYFYYTYSVLDDNTNEFYDYSATDGEYNDYETGVLPFEVPISVHEFVSDKTCLSPGLEVDATTGFITAYDADNELAGEYVNIPDYYSVDNDDGTYEIVKIVGIDPGVFSNNTKIKGIRLSNFISVIPDNLFNGCSSLEYVEYNNIVSIGDNAFKDCTSLDMFEVKESVTNLGHNVFENVKQVIVNVEEPNILNNSANCAAKKLTVNLRADPINFSDKRISVSDKTIDFTINGFKRTYDNFEIVSDSSVITINGLNFANNVGIPITLTSNKVTLINTNVINASNLTMNLKAANTEVIVNGINTFASMSDFAFLSKNISVQKNTSVKSSLNITGGQAYIFGQELTENDLRYFISELGIKYINGEEYNRLLESHYIIFDSNGGELNNGKKLVVWNSKIGELPEPSRAYYGFDGWYTSLEGGEKVTSDTVFTGLTDITLYAHWTINPTSDWVLASEIPDDAQVVDEKWTYTLRSYKTSENADLDGWNEYDSQITSYGEKQGPVYSDPSNGTRKVTSEKYVTSSNYKTEYVYYHYHKDGSHDPVSWVKSSTYPNYAEFVVDSQLSKGGTSSNGDPYYKYWHSSTNWWVVYFKETRQQKVSDNYGTRWYYQEPIYTYYYFKDTELESTADPTGQDDVSNVVKWVRYINK